jgi:hypothetical protein
MRHGARSSFHSMRHSRRAEFCSLENPQHPGSRAPRGSGRLGWNVARAANAKESIAIRATCELKEVFFRFSRCAYWPRRPLAGSARILVYVTRTPHVSPGTRGRTRLFACYDELACAIHRLAIHSRDLVSAIARLVESATTDDNERELGGNGKGNQSDVLFAVPLGEDWSVTRHERSISRCLDQMPFPFE